MMLYCLLFVKSSFTELFKVIMVAILHCKIWSKFWINCNLRLEKYVYIMTKNRYFIMHWSPFFLAIRAWKMIDRFSKNLQLQGKGEQHMRALKPSCSNRNSQDDDLKSTMVVFHFCSTYWISVKSRTYEKLQMPLCTLKIWDLKAWLEFWVYNNSRSHSPTRCSCCCGKRKWEVYTLHDGCECAHFDKSCWGF